MSGLHWCPSLIRFHCCIHSLQRPLDEYDFGVTNLAVDLRDGIRLWYGNCSYYTNDCFIRVFYLLCMVVSIMFY